LFPQPEVVNAITTDKESATPIVYVEGKTDSKILHVAWEKLYGETLMPFRIKPCDPLLETSPGGAGGAGTLSKRISTIPADNPHLAIAIFDRDKEGIDTYENLPKYFVESPSIEAKIAEHNRSAAFLLPVPPGKEKYAAMFNLYLEFYFSDEALEQRTEEGEGLKLRYPEIEVRVRKHGTPVLETKESDLPETRQIDAGKTVFAEQIVPTLDAAEFEPFRHLFERVQTVLTHLLGGTI
jgi:hypothetical protein